MQKDTDDVLKKTGVEIEGADAIEDLEKKFAEISIPPAAPVKSTSQTALSQKAGELEALKNKIAGELGRLKNEVKTNLDSLKKIKDQVEKGLKRIKDLETMMEKITAEILKIKEIESTEEAISEEVEQMQKEAAL